MKRHISIFVIGFAIVGCSSISEISTSRDAARTYLLGRFDEQITELETLAKECPGCGYDAARIVCEVIPPKTKSGIELRTKYEDPSAKIRLYGKKVEVPKDHEGVEKWIATIDGNIANLRTKIVSEKAAADERAAEQERIAKEEAARQEAERIAREKAEAEDRAKRLVGDVEIPRNRIVNGDSVEVWGAYHGRITCKICDLQPGDIELRGVDKYVWATQQFCQKQKDKERAEQERLAKEEAARRAAERIAREEEEAARQEAERIAREKAEAEDRAKRLVGDVEIPRNRIVNGDSIKIFDNHYGNVTCKLSELQPGDVNSFGCPTEQLHRKMSEKLRAKESEYAQKTIADLEAETQQIAAELRQQIPAIAEKIKSDQTLIDINSSGVLDFNWDDIREWRDPSYKYYASLELFNRTASQAEASLEDIGPIFVIEEQAGKKKIALNDSAFYEMLAARISSQSEAIMRGIKNEIDYEIRSSYAHNRINESWWNGVKKKMSKIITKQIPMCDLTYDSLTRYAYECTDSIKRSMGLIKGLLYSIDSAKEIIAAEEEKERQAAEQERIAREEAAAEAEMIRKLVAEMPESEKFPLLAIQPNPQLLMKEIPSGASTKWISAWLATNEVSFEGPEKEITTEFGEERLIKRHTGREMIRAEFFRDGKISRYVTFFFKEDALVELNIVIKETTLSTEQLVEKYSAELGGAAKVEYGTNGVPEKIIGDGTVMPFIQDCFVKIQNDDVCVTHSYKEFAGMICLSESTILSLPFMSAASQARHLKLDKDGLADLIIDGDGNVIRCTQDGELVKDMAIKMVPKFRNLVKQNDMHINVKDKKLCSYFDNLKNAKVEAAAKAAEEARKKEEAAALDF